MFVFVLVTLLDTKIKLRWMSKRRAIVLPTFDVWSDGHHVVRKGVDRRGCVGYPWPRLSIMVFELRRFVSFVLGSGIPVIPHGM